MKRFLVALMVLAAGMAAAIPPAGFVAFQFGGDVEFAAGGMDPEYLTGAYVKTATVTGDTLTIEAQGADGNDLSDITFTGVSEWLDLGDTPSSITADLCVKGNSAGDGLVFAACIGTGTSDGVVDAISIAGSVITLDRTEGLADLTLTIAASNIPDLSAAKITSGALAVARLPSANALDSELPDVSGFLDQTEVDARIATYARVAPSGFIADAQIPANIARDSELPDVGDFVTDADVDGVFDAVSFSNATRDLVFGHYGSGTSTIPLDYLDATQDGRPNAVTSVTVEQGDEVILDSGVYKYIGSVVDTFTTSDIPTDDDFVQIDASGGGLTIEDSGTEEGTGITTINFGANLGVTITGTQADIAGQAGGGGGLSSVSSDATLDGDGTAADPLGVADEGVDTAQLAGNAVTQGKLAANSVHGAQIANSVVGTSELEDDAVTEAKVADSAIGHDQLASNSVRPDEIQANAVTHVKMADDSVDEPELQDGAVTVAKMDSGTATDGHVATADGSGGVAYEAVTTGGAGSSTFVDLTDTPAAITASECVQGNAAGDALVFATCATGGGGTTVTANPGSGATDLTTVTIGTTDYTIAPTATAVTAFECVMTDVAAATYSAVTNILECDGTPTINEGMFVVEDASGTDTTDRVVIQAAGFYQLIVSLHIDSIASTLRTVAIVSFQLERAGTDTVLADQGTEYVRDGVEAASVYHTSLVELEVDDRIGVVLQSEAGSASIGIDGSKSYFAIIRAGGPEGPRGPAGTGSDIDSVDVSYAPDVRVWELTIEQTGGGATFVESTTIPIATQATFGLIEMANGLEVQAGSAINRAIGPSTIQFLDPDQMASGSSADGDVPTADGAGRITWEAQSGGGGDGTVTTSAPVSGDGSAADPVTVANQAISHLKLGSTVAGVDQAAGRILEADGAGDVRWADNDTIRSSNALESIDFPTPAAGERLQRDRPLRAAVPELPRSDRAERHMGRIGRRR